jgi:hypothetical protein
MDDVFIFGSGLQGQATSFCPGSSGIPTECRHLGVFAVTESFDRLVAHTCHDLHIDDDVGRIRELHAELRDGEPIGPMQNGITYIVRPRIEPSNLGFSNAFIYCRGHPVILSALHHP